MGFGQSDKPDIPYSFCNHAHYLERFVELLQPSLTDITLVIQDWGSALGFDYAARHPEKVKAIAFYEAILKPFERWDEFPKIGTNPARDRFRQYRTGDEGGEGWQILVDENEFVVGLLPELLKPFQPSAEELDHYLRPFSEPKYRKPIWRFPKEIPIENDPADVTAAAARYAAWLQQSPIPKLLLWSPQGATLGPEHVEWCRQNLSNLTEIPLNKEDPRKADAHFFQESSPEVVSQALLNWHWGADSTSESVAAQADPEPEKAAGAKPANEPVKRRRTRDR
jgi:haloalkane dehalogenase